MRKFFLTLFFLLTLGIITVVVAVPLVTKIIGPDFLLKVDPPEGVPFGDRDFPIPEQSRISIRLELPISALAETASRNSPRELKGVENKNLHKKMTDGVVNWRMWPGPVKVHNTGKDLTFFLPVSGNAFATGRFGLLKIPVQANVNMEGLLSGRMAPYINSEWEVIPQIKTMVKVRKATIAMGKFGSANDAKEKVEASVLPIIEKETAMIGPALTKALNLKPGIQKLWNQAHVTKQISKQYKSWVVFDPGLAEMGPIDYSNPDSVSMTLGMVAQSFITNNSPENRSPEKLPLLTPVPSAPATAIRVPIIADLKSVNETLKDRTFEIKPKIGPKLKISDARIDLAETPGFLNVRMEMRTVGDNPTYGLSGHFWIKGKPIIDCQKQTLGFTDVSLTVETREAVSKTAAWLMEELLVKSIEAEVRFDLKDHLPRLEDEIYRVITSAPVPEQFELQIEKPKVELLGVYTVNRIAWNQESRPGIVVVLGAQGHINVRLNKL